MARWATCALIAAIGLATAGCGAVDDAGPAALTIPTTQTSGEFPPGPPGPWDDYAWIWDDDVPSNFCLLAAKGATAAQVLDAFEADPQPSGSGDYDAAWELAGEGWDQVPEGALPERSAIQIGELDGWAVAFEPEGYACSMDGVVQSLSQHGRVVSFYESDDGGAQVALADGGKIIRAFDPVLWDAKGATPQEAGLPFDDENANWDALALYLMERWGGPRFTQAWLFDTTRPIHRSMLEPG